jgi:hypothetical protein
MGDDGAQLPVVGMSACPAITIPVTDTMMEAAEMLGEQLTHSQYDALFESIVHIESMELTDADHGIVDADPPADSANTCEGKS